MAALQGTILASKIVPTDSLDTYATHEDKYGRGGHRSVDTLEERDNITTPRRKEGMTVYVKENKTKYILEGGIDNANWKVDSSGGGSGGAVDLSDYYKKTETYSKVEVDTKIADIPPTDLSGYYDKTETETLLSNKVNKEVGKGLSTNDFTNTFKQALESNKVQNITTNSVTKKLVVTYTNGTFVDLNLDDVITDVKVEGAVLDATTNVLTILSSEGGVDVIVDLSLFITTQTLNNALVGKADKIHSHTTSDISGLDTALSNKVTKNEAIVGDTKTKITYDSNGLVTGGADLVEADLPNISQSKITNLVSDLSNKQLRLISGTNIKTINGQSVLGGGDLEITDGGSVQLTGNQTIAGIKTFSSNIVGNITGNSGTATKLETARTINEVAFDGSANITVVDSTKAPLNSPSLTGVPKAPTAAVGDDSTQVATTAFVGAEIADKAYSKTQLDAGQLDNRYYTETEIDTKLAEQNDASEISYDGTVSELVATNVQDAIDEVEGRLDVVEGAVVKLTGDQTIEDVKTFTSSPIVPTPTAVNQAVNKQYVDNMVISPNGSNSYAVAMAIVFGS